MNKKELVEQVKKATGLSTKDIETVVNSTISTIKSTTGDGEKVTLVGFGTFQNKTSAARMGRNPKTGEEIPIAEKTKLTFKAGK